MTLSPEHEGKLAFLSGEKANQNPYHPGDVQHAEWEYGWKLAEANQHDKSQ